MSTADRDRSFRRDDAQRSQEAELPVRRKQMVDGIIDIMITWSTPDPTMVRAKGIQLVATRHRVSPMTLYPVVPIALLLVGSLKYKATHAHSRG